MLKLRHNRSLQNHVIRPRDDRLVLCNDAVGVGRSPSFGLVDSAVMVNPSRRTSRATRRRLAGCLFVVWHGGGYWWFAPRVRSALVFMQCFRKLIDGVNPFHDRGLNSFLDLLVRRIFRVLMRSGNAVTTAFLDAVA